MKQWAFPAWIDPARGLAGLLLWVAPAYAIAGTLLAGAPRTTDVGYMPPQPIPNSHALHAGGLGMDCRYCHAGVDRAANAPVPTPATCMNCHRTIWAESPQLTRLRESAETGAPVPWVRVHDLPDFVFFDHGAHVGRGVGCVSCHGRVDQMVEVWQDQPLSMKWCLACHRAPEPHLRPLAQVTNMTWRAPAGDEAASGQALRDREGIAPPTDCSTCHR